MFRQWGRGREEDERGGEEGERAVFSATLCYCAIAHFPFVLFYFLAI